MTEQRPIAVIGATGAQGGGLVRAILANPSAGFSARAITRNPQSTKALALADAGAVVVAADLDDTASLKAAFNGAYGAYCVTNYWEHYSPDKELAQARALATAAKDTRLRHVIWSTLEDTRRLVPLSDERMPTLMDHYKVPHFDAKGEADKYFSDAGVPTTNFLTSYYWDNLIGFGAEPQRGADGKLAFILPMGDKKLPGMAAEDIGKCAFGIFCEGLDHVGKTVGVAGEFLTGAEMAAALSVALGEPVIHTSVPFEQYRAFDFPGAADLGNMFQYKHDFNAAYLGARSLAVAKRLNPALQTFVAWLAHNADKIPRH